MERTLGVLATRHIWVGAVEDHALIDTLVYPQPGRGVWDPRGVPAEEVAAALRQQILEMMSRTRPTAVGVGFPGVIRGGVVDECPNFPQMKGYNLQAGLEVGVPLHVVNETDAMAAGIAAMRGQLESL